MKPQDIKLNPDNPRVIKDDNFQKLVKSLKEFPEMATVRPVVIDENNVILGGNMRYKAMLEAKWADIPVTQVKGWTEEQKREFIIKDNVSGGEWDWDILANSWDVQKLEDWGVDLPKDLQQTEVEEDEAPEVSQDPPVSQLGEVYQLGRHRVMCGDSTKIDDVEKLMDGKKADMVFTDPPYGMDFQSNMRTKTNKFEALENDDTILTDWIPLLEVFSTGFIFIWTTWKVLDKWNEAVKPLGSLTNLIVWYKGGGGIGDLEHTYSTDYEMAMVFGRGRKLQGKREGSVWEIHKDFAGSYAHPTQKPVALAAMAIGTTTQKDEIVLDLFLGSGSTLIACEQTNRTCYGMELDPKYCDVIRKRYHKFVTGSEEGWQEATPLV